MKSPAAGGGGARNADGEAIGAEGGHIDRLAARIKATEPLQPLLAQRRWVMWRYEARNGGGKPSKAPYVAADPNRHASSKEPRDWCDFETAITAAKRYGLDGVSFALTPTVATTKPGTFTPTATTWIAAFDCDDCRDPKTGALAPWTQDLIEEAQSYVEITPSGIGLRIIGYGRADPAVHNKLKAPGGGSCEIYRQSPKFIAVTGDALDGWNRELANLDAAIDNHRRTTPQAPDRDGGEDRSADYSHRSGDTPGWILDLVRKTDAQDRSKEFFKVIRALKQRGWNSAEIEALFADNIDGIASKYWNRLRQEVDRAFDKPDHEADEGFGSFGSGQGEGPNGPDDGHDDDALSDAEFAAAIQKLAAMDCAAYERARIAASEALGIRVSALDKLVAAKRPPTEAGPGQGKALEISTPEPWDSPVNGASLLDEIEGLVRRFVVCDKHAAVAMALWIALTWFEEAAQIAPILNFKSPVMRCGKSTCLAIVGRLVKRKLLTSNTTTSALFRAIEKFRPTLVIDEADTFFSQNEELRGIINAGHTRETAFTLRTVGEDLEPKTFSTWSFKAVAGIGSLASTIEDRSITIDLKRKTRDETVERLRHADPRSFEIVTRKLVRWAADHMTQFAAARPGLPEALNDRQQDNWDHLLAIGGLAGQAWADRAIEAALTLCGANEEGDVSPQAQLLVDIFEILKTSNLVDENGAVTDIHEDAHAMAGRPNRVVGIPSKTLVTKLGEMEDKPWGEINHGKPLTQNGLARKLKPFGIKSKTIRFGDTTSKGYAAADFIDAFKRYTHSSPETPHPTVTPKQASNFNWLNENPTVTTPPAVFATVTNY